MKTILLHRSAYQRFPPPVDRFQGWLILLCGLLLLCVVGGCDSKEDAHSIHESQEATVPSHENPSSRHGEPSGHTPNASVAPTILAFGDSLTAGLGMAQALSYPAQLQQRLHQAGYDYQVINAGVNGDTTAGGLRRVEWALKSRPSIVIVELGANDGLRGHRIVDTSGNLEQIIQRFQEAGVTVILAGMKIPPNYGLDYTSRFSGMYQVLAERYQIALIPFFLEGVAAIPSLNQADGIHPTAEGYTMVVENVMKVLEPILKE